MPHASNKNFPQAYLCQVARPYVSVPTVEANVALLPATNPTSSQPITTETPTQSELWHVLIEQLNRANQDNKLLKTAVKKTVK